MSYLKMSRRRFLGLVGGSAAILAVGGVTYRRDWQRIHLWGATQGLACQPLNQVCERVGRERQQGIQPVFSEAVRGLLGDDAWQAIMPFRIGYPTATSRPSPRRAVRDVVLSSN